MKHLSLRFKLILGAGLGLALTLTSVILVGWLNMQKSGHEAVEMTADAFEAQMIASLNESAQAVATEVSVFINRSFDVPRTFGTIVTSTASGSGSTAPPFQRATLKQMLGDTLAANEALGSAYAHFEPDGYDWQDAFNIGPHLEHSSDTGVLELYWVREADRIAFYPIEDSSFKYDDTLNDSDMREAEWYLCPKETLRACLIDPYLYEIEEGFEELMTSLVFPLIVDEEFRGVVGVDINLPVIQERLMHHQQALFNGQADIHLFSASGGLVASNVHKDHLSQRIQNVDPELYQLLNSMREPVLQTNGSTLVKATVQFEAVSDPWTVLINVPTAVAFATVYELEENLNSGFQRTAINMVILGIVLLLVAMVILSLWLRLTTQPMITMRNMVEELSGAEGDLTRQLTITNHAELIGISNGFNAFTAKLRAMIADLNASAMELRDQSQSLLHASDQTAKATQSQQEEMQSVASAMTEMSATANEVADLAARTAHQAEESNHLLNDAREAFKKTVDEVKSVSKEISNASDRVTRVAESSQNIYGIIEVIQGIAEQTNLLALNAAIEAARAGDQGRGFAVVADEVRNLARRTQDSTEQINALIENLQKDVAATVAEMEVSTLRVVKTVDEASTAYDQLASAAHNIETITSHVTQVATAAEEQDKVSEEINRNITVVEDASARLASLAGDVREVSEQMSQITDSLESQLRKFKI